MYVYQVFYRNCVEFDEVALRGLKDSERETFISREFLWQILIVGSDEDGDFLEREILEMSNDKMSYYAKRTSVEATFDIRNDVEFNFIKRIQIQLFERFFLQIGLEKWNKTTCFHLPPKKKIEQNNKIQVHTSEIHLKYFKDETFL